LKRIGLLSDTHGSLDKRIYSYFDDCDEIWHAGDIGSMELYENLESWKPVRAVFGNIDGHKFRAFLPEILRFQCEEVKVLMKHIGGYPGRYDRSVCHSIAADPPDLFISGHSHILKVQNDKKNHLLHINPGAAGNIGLHKVKTVVKFDIEAHNIKDLEVFEMTKKQ
jgi:putative phosphoesterase